MRSLAFAATLLAPAILAPAILATPASALTFTAGDLVLSIYGNGDGNGPYNGNQASPIVLKQITTTGQAAGQIVLPQTTTILNGATQYAISGEYGSSSEGSLSRSADGKSLVIAGYGVNASDYNAPSGATTYGGTKNGQPALAQTTSIQGGQYTAVPRVVASIGANGSVDTSTGLYNVYNGNNPRSVATANGSTFYLGGQGATGDGTGGVFVANKGASTATAIDTSTDYRTVMLRNGQLYGSRDYNGPNGGLQSATIESFGPAPTTATAPADLPGIGPSITLTANTTNGVNASRLGATVYLSPENYFFANDTTLYIADSGNPKNGNTNRAQLGEGGLQKWTYANNTWTFQYDIYLGLNLVKNATSNTTPVTTGTSGLIGLTGKVVGDSVSLYATNATLGDLDQTYVFSVTDSLANTNATIGRSETFTTIYTAAPGTIVRGIAFAPEEIGINIPEPTTLALLATTLLLIPRRRR